MPSQRITASVLANTAVSAGVYGGSSNVAAITIDAQGRITSAANVSLPSGGFSNMQVFTSSGTFTVPSGVTKVKVYVIGGGGGSGGNGRSTGGTGSSGDLNLQGGFGNYSDGGGNVGLPGGSFFGFTYGRGGNAAMTNGGSGAGGGAAIKIISGLSSGGTVSVTIGAAGSGSSGSTAGLVVVEY